MTSRYWIDAKPIRSSLLNSRGRSSLPGEVVDLRDDVGTALQKVQDDIDGGVAEIAIGCAIARSTPMGVLWVDGQNKLAEAPDQFSYDPLLGVGMNCSLNVYYAGNGYVLADMGFTYHGQAYDGFEYAGFRAFVFANGGISAVNDMVSGWQGLSGTVNVSVSLIEIFEPIGPPSGPPYFMPVFYQFGYRNDMLFWLESALGPTGPTTWQEDYHQDTIYIATGLGSDFTYEVDPLLTPNGTPSLEWVSIRLPYLFVDASGTSGTVGSTFVQNIIITATAGSGLSPIDCSNNSNECPGLNSQYWGGKQSSDYLDQPVRSTDAPTFASVNINSGVNFGGSIVTWQPGYVSIIVPGDGGVQGAGGKVQLATSPGAMVLIGEYAGSWDGVTRSLISSVKASTPAGGTADWFEFGNSFTYQVDGWSNDSSGRREYTAAQFRIWHLTPWCVNNATGTAYQMMLASGRDWETPGTPTVKEMAAAFSCSVIVRDDYATSVRGFSISGIEVTGQGRTAKVDTCVSAYLGSLGVGINSGNWATVGDACGLDLESTVVYPKGKLNNDVRVKLTLPTLWNGATQDVLSAVGIEVNPGVNMSAQVVQHARGIYIHDMTAYSLDHWGIWNEDRTHFGDDVEFVAGKKLGLFGATPVVQPSTTGEIIGMTPGIGTAVDDQATFTGNMGATAYTINDVVKALKLLGILKV